MARIFFTSSNNGNKAGLSRNATQTPPKCRTEDSNAQTTSSETAFQRVRRHRVALLHTNPGIKPAPVVPKATHSALSNNEILYYEHAKHALRPAPTDKLVIKTLTRTFNHTHEFAIEDRMLWVRCIGDYLWEPLYFDGYPHQIPKIVHSDGANLIVIDHLNQVHYKKILEEYR